VFAALTQFCCLFYEIKKSNVRPQICGWLNPNWIFVCDAVAAEMKSKHEAVDN